MPRAPESRADAIVVIGIGCIYPGAHSPLEFWRNVVAGRRYFRTAPQERMPREYFDRDPLAIDKSYCDKMAVISDWVFDPVRFRIPPNTMRASDLTHWLALETAEQAIADSGINLDQIDRARTGVLLGNTLAGEFMRTHNMRLRWPYLERGLQRVLGADAVDAIAAIREVLNDHLPAANEDTLSGNMANTITGRICNHFNFGGGAFTVDGACSSSLLSVALGCNALLDGDMDLVIAGGVDISLDPFEIVGFAKTQALAKDDIRPYDQRAAGMMTGEGCGIVLLARESEALARGWKRYARIRGWGYSSDGRGGITAPAREGQVRALRKAYERAGYGIDAVGYIEGHGTGTALGDRIELEALLSVFDDAQPTQPCRIGSIKANIGHCKAAAGVAGLIKAIMAVQRGVLPPTLNCERPHGLFAQSGARLVPALEATSWRAVTRRASVSSMGFGGANSHVTLESVDGSEPDAGDLAMLGSAQKSELLVFSARERQQLIDTLALLLRACPRMASADLTDLSAALSQTEPAGELRLALVAQTPWELANCLTRIIAQLEAGLEFAQIDDPAAGVCCGTATQQPKLVMLFPGQGSQRLDMARAYRHRFPDLRALYADTDTALQASLGAALSSYVLRDDCPWDEPRRLRAEQALQDTRIAQPAITLSALAILRVLKELGLTPHLTLGHSLGEIAALCAAGGLDEADAMRIAAARGTAMAALGNEDPGAMAAILANATQVDALLRAAGISELVLANRNSPRQSVVSGPTPAIEAALAAARAAGLSATRLPVSHAFHSPRVAAAGAALAAAMAGVECHDLAAAHLPNHAGPALRRADEIGAHLAAAVSAPVDFISAVEQAAQEQPQLWLEVGPGSVLAGLLRQILPSSEHARILSTDCPNSDPLTQLNHVLARAYVVGFPLRLDRLFAWRHHRPGFALEQFAPVFIANPCENPVAARAVAGLQRAADWLPDDAEYLRQRGPFLREFIELDRAHHRGDTRSQQAPSTPAAHPPESPVPSSAAAPAKSLLQFVTEWIAARTGFPIEAVKPEMKLRDDLNLDSIKVGELGIEISHFLQRTVDYDPSVWANASVRAMAEHFDRAAGERPTIAEASRKGRAIVEKVDGIGHWCRSFRVDHVAAPLSEETHWPLQGSGQAWLVDHDDRELAALAGELRASGLSTRALDLETLLAQPRSPADLAVLVYVMPAMPGAVADLSEPDAHRRILGWPRDLFRLFQWLGRGRDSEHYAVRCIVLRRADPVADWCGDLDAGAALLKTLRLEYGMAQDLLLKWLTLPSTFSPARIAATVMAELSHHSRRVAYSYSEAGDRLQQASLPIECADPGRPAPLGSNDVMLVSGGAKGITCELVLGLARKTGMSLALLGSSARRGADDEIGRNLARFAAAGIRAEYIQADVTDRAALAAAVAQVEQSLGPITAILHGAGITKLQLFRDMPEADFLRCIEIKAGGAYNLLSVVPAQQLKAVHMVSSVLGKTGMRSQADYAFANAWLDGFALSIKKQYPALQLITLGYTLWRETGLGTKLDSFEFLQKVGVTSLTTEEGVDAYVELAMRPRDGTVFTITAPLSSELEGYIYVNAPLRGRPRFLERVLRQVPATELVAETTLTHARDVYLSDHVYEGTPIVPGVYGIEAMVQAACACIARRELPVVRALRFVRPLIVPVQSEVRVRLLALADPPDDDGVVRVRTAIRTQADGFSENHFEAECWFGLALADPEWLPELPQRLDLDLAQFVPKPLFQGPRLRRIEAIRMLEPPRTSLTDVRTPLSSDDFGSPDDDAPLTGSPAVLDSYLQSAALLLPSGALPASIDELRWLRPFAPGSLSHCRVQVSAQSERWHRLDVHGFSADGAPVLAISGLVVREPDSGRVLAPSSVTDLAAQLRALWPDLRFGLAVHGGAAPDRSAVAARNVAAAREALAAFAQVQSWPPQDWSSVALAHHADGKPSLHAASQPMNDLVSELQIGVTDCAGCSIVVVSDRSIGIDLEPISERGEHQWQGLLGEDGLHLAQRLRTPGEPLDLAATLVWSLIEAGRKVHALRRVLPMDPSADGRWQRLHDEDGAESHRCTIVALPDGRPAAFAVALGPAKAGEVAAHHAGETMWAWQMGAVGRDFFRRIRVPKPDLHADQALLKIDALSLNRRDVLIMDGLYDARLRFPIIPGSDFCGRIVQAPDGNHAWRVGQRVFAVGMIDWAQGRYRRELTRSIGAHVPGAAAQWMAFPVSGLVQVPDALTDIEAASLCTAATSAWVAFRHHGALAPGDLVLTLGSGGLATFAVQFAKAMGARIAVITRGGEGKRERLLALGADHVVVSDPAADWRAPVLQWARSLGREGVDLVLETAGVRSLSRSLDVTDYGGTIAYLGAMTGLNGEIDTSALIVKGIRLQGLYLGSARDFADMMGFVVAHQLRPVIDRVFGFDQMDEAFAHLRSGQGFGNVCVADFPTDS